MAPLSDSKNSVKTKSSSQSSSEPPSKKIKTATSTNRRAAKFSKRVGFPFLERMPLDVALEILGHSHPHALLQLSRTTKEFRNLVLGHSGRAIWKRVFDNLPELPECPSEMSLPAWANLLFDQHCHKCGKPHHRNVVDFLLRVRLCKDCAKTHLESEKLWKKEIKSDKLILRCVPFSNWNNGDPKYCLEEDRSTFVREYNATPDASRQEFADKARQKVKERIEHAEQCQEWLEEVEEERETLVEEARKIRRDAIFDKLRELGFDNEITYVMGFDSRHVISTRFSPKLVAFENHPLVKNTRPLTEQVWSNIKDKLIDHMELVRTRWQRQKRLILLQERKENAIFAWIEFRKTLPPTTLMPSLMDVWDLPPVKALIEQDSEDTLSVAVFRAAIDLEVTPEFLRSFRTKQLMLLALKLSHPPTIYPEKVLELATSVFICNKIPIHLYDRARDRTPVYWNGSSEAEEFERILFYPEFLYHSCNTVRERQESYASTEWETYAEDENQELGVDRQYIDCVRDRWSIDGLVVHEKARKMVEKVLETCGLGPETTVQELDDLDPRLICLKCTHGGKADGERLCQVWSWRNTIKHCLKMHWGHAVPFQMISRADAAKARDIEATEYKRRSLRSPPKDKRWRCMRCIDTPKDLGRMAKEDLQSHFVKNHYNGVWMKDGVDYYQTKECGPLQPLTVKMVPQAVVD